MRPSRHDTAGSEAHDLEQQSRGSLDKADFIYIANDDEYLCPAGERATWRMTTVEEGRRLHRYWPSACPTCPLKKQCTPSDYRRMTRWEREDLLGVEGAIAVMKV